MERVMSRLNSMRVADDITLPNGDIATRTTTGFVVEHFVDFSESIVFGVKKAVDVIAWLRRV